MTVRLRARAPGVEITDEGSRAFTDVVARALGLPALRVIATGGEVYASERRQRDSGNRGLLTAPPAGRARRSGPARPGPGKSGAAAGRRAPRAQRCQPRIATAVLRTSSASSRMRRASSTAALGSAVTISPLAAR